MASIGGLESKLTLHETARGSPALAADDDGRLLLAWAGTDSPSRINVMSSADGIAWSGKAAMHETTGNAPAVAVDRGRVFVAWTGDDRKHSVNLVSTADEKFRAWDEKIVFSESSLAGPALAVGGGRLYLAWTGLDRRMNVMSWDGGATWSDKVTLSETSAGRPSLVVQNDTLYVLWSGTDRAHSLNAIAVTPDGQFGDAIALGETSPYTPVSAVGADGLPRLLWTGSGNRFLNAAVYGAPLPDGLSSAQADKRTYEDTAADGPAACAWQGRIALAWTGTDQSGRLNVATLSAGGTA
jgi:hypothetical protein